LTQISLDWPTAAITPEAWRRRVEDLAAQAERMIGKQCSLQQQAQLALSWAGLCWSGFSPETVAASARASLLLGESVVMATAPADQLQEIAERLDHVWQAAQSDPSAAVATVMPPLIDLPPAESVKRPRARSVPDVEQEGFEEPPADIEPPPPAAPRRERRPLRAASERMARRPAPADPPAVAVEAEPVALPQALVEEPEAVAVEAQPQAQPEPAPSPPPAGWLVAPEVAELLDTSEVSVGRWRSAGRFGAKGEGWVRSGRSYYYSPPAVEAVMAGDDPPGLDQLLADVQAA